VKSLHSFPLSFLFLAATATHVQALEGFDPATPVAAEEQPPLPQARRVAPGVVRHEVKLKGNGPEGVVWIYLPEKPPAGKLPCVLIAPAGSILVTGMKLDKDDSKEHLPYVKAGMAVIAYALDGNLENAEQPKDAEILAAAKAFKESEAGVANAKAALDYALAKVPSIDPKRIYTAGHSSAATVSLVVAAKEPRIAGCIAYAPATNFGQRIPAPLVNALAAKIPDYKQFLQANSPLNNAPKIGCPVFLFHAADDSNVPVAQSENFIRVLKKTNMNVTFFKAKTGDHFDGMMAQGIPLAIKWIKELPAK
jgi:dienelactone hydrolase